MERKEENKRGKSTNLCVCVYVCVCGGGCVYVFVCLFIFLLVTFRKPLKVILGLPTIKMENGNFYGGKT